MKKLLILFVILLVSLGLTLAGCGKKAEQMEEPAPVAEPETQEAMTDTMEAETEEAAGDTMEAPEEMEEEAATEH